MAKRVNIGVFHILKSIVDSKVAVAKPLADAAKRAEIALPGLGSHLQSLRDWEHSISRYETPRYEDGEDTPTDLENKIEAAKQDIALGASAVLDLKFADKFNTTYKLAMLEPQMEAFRADLRDAEAWAEHWSRMRNGISLDDYEDADDMERDKAYYTCEYERAVKNVRDLKSKLIELQNIK
ncbi:MAG: hypothetical protein IJD41_04100 [Alphaproteobacteria bacterium]|nr:hypothetical protein [Alphaproteobacteria bacterium]MBQ7127542.1 hypothetical protein [Alphaproteobacteria bacterium]